MSAIRQGWHGAALDGLKRQFGKSGVKRCCLIHIRRVGYDQIANPIRFDLNIFHCVKQARYRRRRVILNVFHDLPAIAPFHHWHGDWKEPTLKRRVNSGFRRNRHGWKLNNWPCICGQFRNAAARK